MFLHVRIFEGCQRDPIAIQAGEDSDRWGIRGDSHQELDRTHLLRWGWSYREPLAYGNVDLRRRLHVRTITGESKLQPMNALPYYSRDLCRVQTE